METAVFSQFPRILHATQKFTDHHTLKTRVTSQITCRVFLSLCCQSNVKSVSIPCARVYSVEIWLRSCRRCAREYFWTRACAVTAAGYLGKNSPPGVRPNKQDGRTLVCRVSVFSTFGEKYPSLNFLFVFVTHATRKVSGKECDSAIHRFHASSLTFRHSNLVEPRQTMQGEGGPGEGPGAEVQGDLSKG